MITSVDRTFPFFLITMATGLGLFLPYIKYKDTGWGFPRLVLVCMLALFVCWGLLELDYLKAHLLQAPGLLACTALFSLVVSQWVLKLEKLPPAGEIPLAVVINLTMLFLCFYYRGLTGMHPWWLVGYILFLGSHFFALLLGHWYLVVPKMSEQPLKNVVFVGMFFMVLRHVVGGGLGLFSALSKWEEFSLFIKMMFIMRALWGLLIVAVMDYFTLRLVKMRSLQSATGIIYATCFFVLVGELISIYLFFNQGVYF